MNLKKKYYSSKCPHCNKGIITFKKKMNLVDYRYSYNCEECGGNIQLPAWHAVLYLSETVILIGIIAKSDIGNIQIVLSWGLFLIFVLFIQLPFIPVRR